MYVEILNVTVGLARSHVFWLDTNNYNRVMTKVTVMSHIAVTS